MQSQHGFYQFQDKKFSRYVGNEVAELLNVDRADMYNWFLHGGDYGQVNENKQGSFQNKPRDNPKSYLRYC